jgi:D-3-phosphoglycerate dehydrogenase
MKDGALFLNLSRGFVVDVEALAKAVRSGKLGGAAVDVFPEEPSGNGLPFASPLVGLPNVILTPHIGGSTREAQRNIADFVSGALVSFVTPETPLDASTLGSAFGSQASASFHTFAAGRVLASINAVMADHGINILGNISKPTSASVA